VVCLILYFRWSGDRTKYFSSPCCPLTNVHSINSLLSAVESALGPNAKQVCNKDRRFTSVPTFGRFQSIVGSKIILKFDYVCRVQIVQIVQIVHIAQIVRIVHIVQIVQIVQIVHIVQIVQIVLFINWTR
jgi:hypothetical protein